MQITKRGPQGVATAYKTSEGWIIERVLKTSNVKGDRKKNIRWQVDVPGTNIRVLGLTPEGAYELAKERRIARKNPGLTDKAIKIEVPGPESKSRYVRERVASPGYFRPSSFRTIQTGEHRIIRGKRKGQREWETQAILHPESERRSLMRQARTKGIPVARANPGKGWRAGDWAGRSMSRSQREDLAEFPVGTKVVIRRAEGKWGKMGFEATGKSVLDHGVIKRPIVPEDSESVIVRLDNGDSTRISTGALRASRRYIEDKREENPNKRVMRKGIPVVRTNPDPRIASTILQQLGGNRFVAMTGAKNLMAISNGLSITLPSRFAKNNINRVHIVLTPMDTYDLRFMEVRVRVGDVGVKEVKVLENVYADQLREVFTRVTGLDVHLNPKKKARNPSSRSLFSRRAKHEAAQTDAYALRRMGLKEVRTEKLAAGDWGVTAPDSEFARFGITPLSKETLAGRLPRKNPSFACPGCGKAVEGDYQPGTYYCRGCRTALRVT